MTNLTVWSAAFCAVTTACHLVGIIIAAVRLGRHRECGRVEQPPVSLIRPVCGIDNFAAETLASSFTLDWPDCEVIFCVARPDDAALPLLRALIAAHPERPARLLIGDDKISRNPKLNNIVKGWDTARHRWIIIADSNALLPRDGIRQLVAAWRSDTGLVCTMPIGARPQSFWAEVECAFLNTLQARYQYVAESLGCGFAQGKTILFRRDIVDRAGGIAALAIDDAEDAAATKLVHAAGLKVNLVDRPFAQPLGRRSVGVVWFRQLRWARLRRGSFPMLYVPEILLGSALPTLASVIAAAGYGLDALPAVIALLSLWIAAELALAGLAGWRCSWRQALAIVVRDLLLPVLWFGGLVGSRLTWRGTVIDARQQILLDAEGKPSLT